MKNNRLAMLEHLSQFGYEIYKSEFFKELPKERQKKYTTALEQAYIALNIEAQKEFHAVRRLKRKELRLSKFIKQLQEILKNNSDILVKQEEVTAELGMNSDRTKIALIVRSEHVDMYNINTKHLDSIYEDSTGGEKYLLL